MPKFKGVPMQMGDQQLILPPMSLGIIEDFQDQIDDMLAGKVKKPVSLMIDIFHRTLQRNYPELTRDQVREGLGLDDLQGMFATLLKASGWEVGSATPPPEGTPEGEPLAAGTGAASTPTSSPAAASTPTTGETT